MSTHPPLPAPQPSPSPPPRLHPLSDIFPDSPPTTPTKQQPHPSDIPRLRATHSTAGYRTGISASKTESLQPGFDEGYALGAVLGLRVGYLLGALEGLCAALRGKPVIVGCGDRNGDRDKDRDGDGNGEEEGDEEMQSRSWTIERTRLEELLVSARRELAMENVFGKEWWAEDGTWRFAVEGLEDGPEGKDRGDLTFVEVADKHPLLELWSGRVGEELNRWGVHGGNFEGEEWENGRVRSEEV